MAFEPEAMVIAYLSIDSTLTALLSTYRTLPAMFTSLPVPVDARRPYLTIMNQSQGQIAEHLDRRHLPDVLLDVGCYQDRGDDARDLTRMIDRVHEIFFGNGSRTGVTPTWSAAGYTLLETDVVAGPFPAPTDENVRGRMVTVRAMFRRT